jgi:dienelactone hydrolase
VNAPVAIGEFPHIVFGHGFIMTWSAYQNIWEALVPRGYIVMFPRTEDGLSPSHDDFGLDLALVAENFKLLNTNAGSIFFGKLSQQCAVAGHSMGGGAAHLAAQNNPNIQAMFTLAAAETNPSTIAAAGLINVPVLNMAGTNDCVTPPADHQILMYNATASNCKAYVSITGGNHCQFANSNTNCSLGELTCTPAATISRTVQHQRMFQYLIPWLDQHLKGAVPNPSFQNLLNAAPASEITWQLSCPGGTTATHNATMANLRIFPNPTSDVLYVQCEETAGLVLTVFDLTGKVIHTDVVQSPNSAISCNRWSNGVYVLRLENEQTVYQARFIKTSFTD